MPNSIFPGLIWSALLAVFMAVPASAQMEDTTGRLVIELNATQSSAEGCTFSFLVINGLEAEIESLVLEAVLFDGGGQVDRLTLFDLGALPVARPRVRQFAVPGQGCDGFGSVLINGAQTCQIGGQASSSCEEMLDPRSRVEMGLIG